MRGGDRGEDEEKVSGMWSKPGSLYIKPVERSGMGFTVMETFMDEVEVHSEKGKGTVVLMRKKFASLAKGQGVSGNEG